MGSLDRSQRALILALASRIVPAAAALDAGGRNALLALVDDALALRSRATRRQFAIFLSVLRWAPVLRYGRPLDRLDPARQDAVLRGFQDAPVTLLRTGFWGVRTLILLGYYGRVEAGESIGYRPSRTGNAALHD